MLCYGLKSFGERIAARDPSRQTAEIHIRIALKNRFNSLGTAETVRVASSQLGYGDVVLQFHSSATMPVNAVNATIFSLFMRVLCIYCCDVKAVKRS